MTKFIKKGSIYKYVHVYELKNGIRKYHILIHTDEGHIYKTYNTEREAAIAVDKYFISIGKDPIHILKPKIDKK